MKYQLLIFDWDGTLMDSAARIISSLVAAFSEINEEPPSPNRCRDIIGLGLDEAIARLWPQASAEQRVLLVERYRRHYLETNQTPTPLFDRAAAVVAGLHANGYLMAVATGKSRRGLDAALRETGLGPWFHATRCADEAPSKPHPQMLSDLMDELGVDPAESLMIGDTEYDLQMAANAGVDAVAVSCGAHDERRLLARGPLACLKGIEELPGWLGRQAAG